MAVQTIDTSIGWIGNGAILISKLDNSDKPVGGFYAIAHSSSAVLALSVDKVEMQDTTYGTLSAVKSKVIKTTGELTLNAKDFNVEVMKLALFADITKDAAAAEKTWVGNAFLGRSVVVPGLIASVASITIAGEPVTEDQYRVSGGSIEFDAAASFEDGAEATIVYSTKATTRLEGLINSNINVQIVFEGFNLGEDDQNVKVTYHKVSLSPAAQRQLITADWGDQEIKGTLLASKAVNGSGVSKLFKEEYA
ncbi:hypothetical protein I5S78_02790 [Pseudomonas putida]|uniref:phage tail tube protein n=1 Tax=Pseudomonas putida TaxID=303 RepID=UPI0018D6B3A4|nr:hypothetical protein [Pseudomonas putida]MBH3415293.1 hypothetical protein [Pseudomonas putida]